MDFGKYHTNRGGNQELGCVHSARRATVGISWSACCPSQHCCCVFTLASRSRPRLPSGVLAAGARLPLAVGSRKREREGEIESDRGGCALAIGTFGPRQRVGYGARRAWSRPRCEHVMAHGCVRDSIRLFIQLFSFKKYCLLCYNNIEMAM